MILTSVSHRHPKIAGAAVWRLQTRTRTLDFGSDLLLLVQLSVKIYIVSKIKRTRESFYKGKSRYGCSSSDVMQNPS
jgi:hypothetical protein